MRERDREMASARAHDNHKETMHRNHKEPKQQKRATLLRRLQRITDELRANNANDTPLDGIPDGYVSCAQACAMLRISGSVLRRHIDKGHISTSSKGWRVYCSVDDIRAEIVRQHERKQAEQNKNASECPV